MIKKIIRKPLFYPALVALIMLFSVSAHNSFWPSNQELNTNDKMIFLKFQDLKGSNRINEGNQMWHSLFSKLTNSNHKVITTAAYSILDIEKMFGKPDFILQNGNWVYYLNTCDQNCKIVVSKKSDTTAMSYNIDECK